LLDQDNIMLDQDNIMLDQDNMMLDQDNMMLDQDNMRLDQANMRLVEEPASEGCEWRVVVFLGVATFCLVNRLTGLLVPDMARQTRQQSWKWRNVATSLVHSLITGIWAPLAFYQAPDMQDDLIRKFTYSSHMLVCFSIGYFLYDALDMLLYHRKRSTYELLVHHALVILCFFLAVTSRQYVAYGTLSLMVEINSVFLHTRQLFIITQEPKSSIRYKTNALLNVATFLSCRILLLGWMTRWLTMHREEIPLTFFTAGSVGLAVIVVMNIILFCRILSVDFSGMFSASCKPETKDHSKARDLIQYLSSLAREDDRARRKIAKD
jgi:hypothetical protein